jgi:hypothetical protein
MPALSVWLAKLTGLEKRQTMDRREFFQSLALTAAAAQALPLEAAQSETPDVAAHTLQCEFQYNNTAWKVYEDLSKRDGSIAFVPARGAARVLGKRPEAVFSQTAVPLLGLSQKEIADSLPEWMKRSDMLLSTTLKSIEKWTLNDKTPPYVPLLPGSKLTFKQAMAAERPSEQQWPHRPYAELLMADVLPHPLANKVVDTMRAYGAMIVPTANEKRFEVVGQYS